jgi:hypothetical protein
MITLDELNDPKDDHANQFEKLACYAFKCESKRDPWGIASIDTYIEFVESPSMNGKKAFSKILTKLILDSPDVSKMNKLLELEENVWVATSQEEIGEIIEETIKTLTDVGINN